MGECIDDGWRCAGFFGLGALLLGLLSTVQKWMLDVPLDLRGFIFPLLVGGSGGAAIGWLIMHLRRQNAELSHSEQRYRHLYQHTPVMLHSIDRNGRILDVSEHWLTSLGYQRSEVVGQHLTTFFYEESQRRAEREVLPRFFRDGEVRDIPYSMRRRDGGELEVLISAISERDADGTFQRSLAVVHDVTERNLKAREVERLAYYDTLTGLPNRFQFRRQMETSIVRAAGQGTCLALLLIDLDRFKGINDTLGHQEGDTLLRTVAGRLRGMVPTGQTLARLGGDEFGLLIEGAGSKVELAGFARALLDQIVRPVTLGPRELTISGSLGIAVYPEHGEHSSELLSNADTALYAAKGSGRNTHRFFAREMNLAAAQRMQLESDLRLAIERGEFRLHYQPQIDVATCRAIGVEALLRWHHPERGLLGPKHFIALAEETGLIVPIGDWVLEQACRQAVAWRRVGLPPLRMAVNITCEQFMQAHFVERVAEVLQQSGFEPQLLELELTEGIVMEKTETTLLTLADLKVLQVGLAVDDFGTGYSSLSYLKHFPFDRIKIAQEFVRDIPHDTDSTAIVRAILNIAASLDLAVVAEGVETVAQFEFLRNHGCREMQGFLFAEPVVAELLTARLANPLDTCLVTLPQPSGPVCQSSGT